MSDKSVILLPEAERDADDIMKHYRHEGGSALSTRWAESVELALRHVAAHPSSGSPRYMDLLSLPGLRFWPVRHFPYLVFYVEYEVHVDVWRVLHAERDLPRWLQHQE